LGPAGTASLVPALVGVRAQTEPGLLHIHQNTLDRTLELRATAQAAGRPRVAERNERMAAAIQHLIDRVHQDEARHQIIDANAVNDDRQAGADAS
jgi:hypothetical protein